MYAVVGTIPETDFPLVSGQTTIVGDQLEIAGRRVPINRGTAALLAAAFEVGTVMGIEPPMAFLVGDIGLGDGSRKLYAWLETVLPELNLTAICFHYLQPDVDWQYRVLIAARSHRDRPLLIADAGFMYAAKMGGQSDEYDLFTPDAGELAFLADEEAPHPFYTRGFILHQEQKVPELIERAYRYQNAAEYLLVKGGTDYIAHKGRILATVDQPSSEAMEAIGGTGDTLTGIVTALIAAGLPIDRAALMAAGINRRAGQLADLNPASQVEVIIAQIGNALREALKDDLSEAMGSKPMRPGTADAASKSRRH
jgi:ADP-dependent NAD(P)H-hydrate dehydratase / NAD(P)H-hydrate epimerase